MKKNLKEEIQKESKRILDPAGREVDILEDTSAQVLAKENECSLGDIYREALSLGIYPYRYLRNREIISEKEQLTLAESRVSVIGAGGLGGTLILLLARIGIGHLVVVDHDVFDETNLNRQALSSSDAIGRPKSDQAESIIKSVNPGVAVTSYPIRIEPSNANEILKGSNVVVDALDNVADRLVLQEEAEKLNIPLVHGALAGFEGQVMTVFPGDRGMKLLYGNTKKEGKDPKSPEAILGVPTFTPSFVATLQAMEVLKIILNRGNLLRHTMLHVDLENASLNKFSFSETE